MVRGILKQYWYEILMIITFIGMITLAIYLDYQVNEYIKETNSKRIIKND